METIAPKEAAASLGSHRTHASADANESEIHSRESSSSDPFNQTPPAGGGKCACAHFGRCRNFGEITLRCVAGEAASGSFTALPWPQATDRCSHGGHTKFCVLFLQSKNLKYWSSFVTQTIVCSAPHGRRRAAKLPETRPKSAHSRTNPTKKLTSVPRPKSAHERTITTS